MKGFLLGLILGLAVLPVGIYVYFRNGHAPVAVADQPYPLERHIVRIPLQARIEAHVQEVAPIEPTPANLAAGALIYRQQCAFCHGSNGHSSAIAQHMYPHPPQLWEHQRKGVVGVSDDPPGETYWKIANGIRLTGMPAFDKLLSKTQMWQVTLLLSRANQPLPAGAGHVLSGRAAPVPSGTTVTKPPEANASKPPEGNRVKLQPEPGPAPGPDRY